MIKFFKSWRLYQRLDDDRATLRPDDQENAERFNAHQAMNHYLKSEYTRDQSNAPGDMRARIIAQINQRPKPQARPAFFSAVTLWRLLPIMGCFLIGAILLGVMATPLLRDVFTNPNHTITGESTQNIVINDPREIDQVEAEITLVQAIDDDFNPVSEFVLFDDEPETDTTTQLAQNDSVTELNNIATDADAVRRTLLSSLPVHSP